MFPRGLASTLFVFLLIAAIAFGQVTGRISGSIQDVTGASVPNATIHLSLPGSTAVALSTVATSEGLFSFSSVSPGTYELSVEAPGFLKYTMRGVKVNPSQDTSVPAIKLDVQSVQQSVEVTADAAVVQTSESQISSTVSQEQVRNLPVLDRQVSSLFLTQPGVSSGRGPTTINGLRTANVNLTLDGINIQDNYIRSNALDYVPGKFTIEQVAELSIATSNQNASLGLGAAQVTMVTPSGSNQYHGSLYWYNRNSYFAANDWFNNQSGIDRPFLNQNQAGGSFGGHLIKDKLFFYTNYEAFRLRQQSPITRTILTPNARNGVFSYLDTQGNVRQANLLQLRKASVDPAIAALLAQMPVTGNDFSAGDSRPGQLLNTVGYAFNASSNEDRNSVLSRWDYILSPRHTITATYNWNTDKVDRPLLANDYVAKADVFNDNHAHLFSMGWRYNIGATLTNEVRGGFNLAPGLFNRSGQQAPYFLAGLLFSSPVNNWERQGRDTDTYSMQDNANWVKGKHNVFFGFQTQLIRTAPFDFAGTTPLYNLALNEGGFDASELPGIRQVDLATADALYANLAGIVSDYTQTFNVTSRTSGFVPGTANKRHYSYDTYSGYVQDNWKVGRRLTLNLGLRYDYYTRLNERDSLIFLPQLENGNYITSLRDPNNTLNFAGGSAGRPFYNADRNNFAPNIGFAWDVFGDGKTAVRGGYTLSYINDDTIHAILNIITTSPGLSSAASNDEPLVGKLTGALPGIPTPQFTAPLPIATAHDIDPLGMAIGLPDPNLRTPYVQQYSLSIEREIKDTVFRVSYIGNHGTKLLRAFDYNQIVINENGFLPDFIRARNNAFLSLAATGKFNPAYNANIAGSQPLTVFPKLFQGGLLTNSTVLSNIRTGQVGGLAAFYQQRGLNGSVDFFRNPNTNGANSITNYSNSTYNSVQFDLTHRMRGGTQFQFNYVFSKALTDAGFSADDQNRFEPFLDFNNGKIERGRAPSDVTHILKGNYVFEMPFGHARRWDLGRMNPVLGGWALSGIWTYESGTPFSIFSSRATLNRSGLRSFQNTANSPLTKGQLDQHVGFFKTGNGLYFIDPAVIGPDGRGVASDGSAPFSGQIFFNPDPGTVGALQRRQFNGPWDFNYDMSILKRFRVTEHQQIEFRMDAFNVFNHPSFWAGDENLTTTFTGSSPFNINSTQFGRISSLFGTFNSPRRLQFGLYYRF